VNSRNGAPSSRNQFSSSPNTLSACKPAGESIQSQSPYGFTLISCSQGGTFGSSSSGGSRRSHAMRTSADGMLAELRPLSCISQPDAEKVPGGYGRPLRLVKLSNGIPDERWAFDTSSTVFSLLVLPIYNGMNYLMRLTQLKHCSRRLIDRIVSTWNSHKKTTQCCIYARSASLCGLNPAPRYYKPVVQFHRRLPGK
jgi:hypothetical protein